MSKPAAFTPVEFGPQTIPRASDNRVGLGRVKQIRGEGQHAIYGCRGDCYVRQSRGVFAPIGQTLPMVANFLGVSPHPYEGTANLLPRGYQAKE